LRKAALPFAGKKLHLVQFVGPIKPEWREALEQTGVSVVHYVPQNAYLVHGDNAALAKLQAWAQVVDYLQWEGDYANDYKLHPRTRALDAKGNAVPLGTDWYAIQLVDDAEANALTLALIEQLKLAPIRQQYRSLNYLNLVVRIARRKAFPKSPRNRRWFPSGPTSNASGATNVRVRSWRAISRVTCRMVRAISPGSRAKVSIRRSSMLPDSWWT
jgi:hypothetical protein